MKQSTIVLISWFYIVASAFISLVTGIAVGYYISVLTGIVVYFVLGIMLAGITTHTLLKRYY